MYLLHTCLDTGGICMVMHLWFLATTLVKSRDVAKFGLVTGETDHALSFWFVATPQRNFWSDFFSYPTQEFLGFRGPTVEIEVCRDLGSR